MSVCRMVRLPSIGRAADGQTELYVYAACSGGKVADIRMNGGTVEIRGLKPGIYYYRLELKDTEEAVAGKLLVRSMCNLKTE